jgi:hypothetical protein
MSSEARALALASVPSRRDVLSEELEAMATIGRVLDGIDDPVVRQRVLRWSNDRSLLIERPSSASANASVEISHDDSALAVDSLSDMFPSDRLDREESRDKLTLVAADRPVEATLRSFVADFQRLAKDWQDI